MPRIISSGWKSGDLRIWSGEINNIPSGWELATEMIDRAVVGAGGAYSKGQKFGSDSKTPSISVWVDNHTLSAAQMPSHGHSYNTGTTPNSGSASNDVQGTSVHYSTNRSTNGAGNSWAHNHGAGASSSAIDTRQKSIAVIWIRKL